MTTISGDPAHAEKHLREALSLDAEGYASLFLIRMFPEGEAEIEHRMSPMREVNWQGYLWESYAVGITGYKKESSGESNRPKMTLFNPNGFFSRYVHAGLMDNAEVIRYRVLGSHLLADTNSYIRNSWRVSKVAGLNKSTVVVELRDVLDGPFFILPGRAYYPPEFPSVSL